MAKLTEREKEAHYRQKISKEYKTRIDDLNSRNRELSKSVIKLTEENEKLVKENKKLKEDIDELKHFKNITEDEFKMLLSKSEADREVNAVFNRIFRGFYI